MRKAEKTDQLRETVVPCVRAPFELECFSPLEVWFFQKLFPFFSFLFLPQFPAQESNLPGYFPPLTPP